MYQFFEILISSRDFWGDVHYAIEIKQSFTKRQTSETSSDNE